MKVYCLFCETIRCGYVARSIERVFGFRAISPKQVQHTWSEGRMVDIEHDLLPGYVFVYLEDGTLDISRLRSIQGVIRCLTASGSGYELSGSDEQFAMMLYHSGGIIGRTKVYREGQMIRICKGVFEGVETKILKVNRHKSRMQIELPFAHMLVRTWVQYEIVQDQQ